MYVLRSSSRWGLDVPDKRRFKGANEVKDVLIARSERMTHATVNDRWGNGILSIM